MLMSKISISSKVLLYTVAIRRIRYQPVEKKKKERNIRFGLEPGSQALICRCATALVRVERLLSGCEGCYPREGRHRSGLSTISSSHLGSFTESISKNQSWGKGKSRVTTPTHRRFSATSGLSTSQQRGGKKERMKEKKKNLLLQGDTSM